MEFGSNLNDGINQYRVRDEMLLKTKGEKFSALRIYIEYQVLDGYLLL